MFGSNKTVADNSITSHGKIYKRHVALSFHRSREEVSSKIVSYFFVEGKINSADVLTKYWAHHDIWPT